MPGFDAQEGALGPQPQLLEAVPAHFQHRRAGGGVAHRAAVHRPEHQGVLGEQAVIQVQSAPMQGAGPAGFHQQAVGIQRRQHRQFGLLEGQPVPFPGQTGPQRPAERPPGDRRVGTGAEEITKLRATLKAYIYEAIEIEKAGLKVELKKTVEYTMPEELKSTLDKNAALKKAFKALTPGRQRGYIFYISSAKQAKTREARIEKYISHIMAGKGIDD